MSKVLGLTLGRLYVSDLGAMSGIRRCLFVVCEILDYTENKAQKRTKTDRGMTIESFDLKGLKTLKEY